MDTTKAFMSIVACFMLLPTINANATSPAASTSSSSAKPVALPASKTPMPAPMYQMDVCNRHAALGALPSMTLSLLPTGDCVVAARTMKASGDACPVSSSDAALQLKFACTSLKRDSVRVNGPTLNIWASSIGGASGTSGICNLTTHHPKLFSHTAPHEFSYGFAIRGVPCAAAAATHAVLPIPATSAAAAAGNAAVAAESAPATQVYQMQNGIWVVPELDPPPYGNSVQAQSCRLVVDVWSATYISTASFPCNMQPAPQDKVKAAGGMGCCFNPATPARRLRRLLM